jgi:hypothetical protein
VKKKLRSADSVRVADWGAAVLRPYKTAPMCRRQQLVPAFSFVEL